MINKKLEASFGYFLGRRRILAREPKQKKKIKFENKRVTLLQCKPFKRRLKTEHLLLQSASTKKKCHPRVGRNSKRRK